MKSKANSPPIARMPKKSTGPIAPISAPQKSSRSEENKGSKSKLALFRKNVPRGRKSAVTPTKIAEHHQYVIASAEQKLECEIIRTNTQKASFANPEIPIEPSGKDNWEPEMARISPPAGT
jgi:hypothetical protein